MNKAITVGELLDRAECGEFAIINDGNICGFEKKEIAPSDSLARTGAIH